MKIEVAIVGISRCGTTFLYRSIAGLLPGQLSPEISVYRSLPMIKAHSLNYGWAMETMLTGHLRSNSLAPEDALKNFNVKI